MEIKETGTSPVLIHRVKSMHYRNVYCHRLLSEAYLFSSSSNLSLIAYHLLAGLQNIVKLLSSKAKIVRSN